MSNTMLTYTCNTIHWFHEAILQVTDDLTFEQFTWLPGPEAPPIGWHLWHIARWADRVQTAMPERNGVHRQQIWEANELTRRYELDPTTLGVVGCGEGMAFEAAARLPQAIGQENILSYARQAFAGLDVAVDELTPEEIEWVRPNCRPYAVTADKQIVAALPQEEVLFGELAFHIRHAGRHLGMIEGLRGAQGFFGTASA